MVLVFVEHARGELDELSLQALTFARGYAGGEPVEAVVAGPGTAEAAGALGAHGVATVHVAEHDALADGYAPEVDLRGIVALAPGAELAHAERAARTIEGSGRAVLPIEVPDAEAGKTIEVAARCWDALGGARFTVSLPASVPVP